MAETAYDLVTVGTGFASSFFLHEYLRHRKGARVLVLERGERRDHAFQLENPAALRLAAEKSVRLAGDRDKLWRFAIGFGGGSNCWWACTPRMLPEDFELRTRYGVGADWPVRYDDLEPYYVQAERLMCVSGPSSDTPFRRSAPYPDPPHRWSEPDRVLKRAFPDAYFVQPCARTPAGTTSGRPVCCGNGVCSLCPIGAKFTIENGMAQLYQQPNVTLRCSARAVHVEASGDRATELVFEHEGKLHRVRADLFVLGANAIFNAHLLLRSGIQGGPVGEGLVEQVGRDFLLDLRDLDAFQGSTSITGHGYMHYGGAHRADHAAALVEVWNVPMVRLDRGKYQKRIKVKFIFEDLRQPQNRVEFDPADPERPVVRFERRSDYAERALGALPAKLDPLLSALRVERVEPGRLVHTEAHAIGTTVMGTDASESVVDADLVHHRVRNLLVLGSGAFPSAAPANPTLTLSALSLRAANRLVANGGPSASEVAP